MPFKSPIIIITGYGSSAVVYSAVYIPHNKRVAIKVIDLDMFERNQIDELRVLYQPKQNCVVVIFYAHPIPVFFLYREKLHLWHFRSIPMFYEFMDHSCMVQNCIS
jgi:hypothetical protein